MERSGPGESLHHLVAHAIERAARVHEESSALIDDCRRASAALHDTIETTHRKRDARADAASRK